MFFCEYSECDGSEMGQLDLYGEESCGGLLSIALGLSIENGRWDWLEGV